MKAGRLGIIIAVVVEVNAWSSPTLAQQDCDNCSVDSGDQVWFPPGPTSDGTVGGTSAGTGGPAPMSGPGLPPQTTFKKQCSSFWPANQSDVDLTMQSRISTLGREVGG